MSSIRTAKDLPAITKSIAESIQGLIKEKTSRKESFSVALCGGSTPYQLYKLLSKSKIDWSSVHIFLGDERFVPPDDPASNYGMINKVLLSKIPIPQKNIHPPPFIPFRPEESAQRYERIIKDFFKLKDGELPSFDLMLLGIGEDGHTASLFPNTAILEEKKALVGVCDEVEPTRLSLTFPVLNNSENIYFLVSGANKKEAASRILSNSEENVLPAQRIRPVSGNLVWYLTLDAHS